ncbi:RNA polymerase sigma factor [Pseudomonas fluorescens]|uniref:RNA polymerase sigma factor n=1 Tax=Pseudomonas fluorescens TaxID=294 RepID=UPI001A9D035B|nr:sigma-70 family RNA polymerase sigma factor [Pseudomonas fluorescens]QTD31460.1 sigma-70 family RNA polymerase sigma factor [Pseudomonas fluorescens]
MTSDDESQLISRLLQGEQKAYCQLVDTYQNSMYAVAVNIVGSAQAEEVVQDAWLSVVRNLARFEGRSSLKTWLLIITANIAKSRYRNNRRELLLSPYPAPHGTLGDVPFSILDGHWLMAPLGWHEDTPEALLSESELRECLEDALQCLPEMQRNVLLMRERQGLALEEIGHLLEISPSNVRVLLHRARSKVFASMEHFEVAGHC